MEETLWQPIQAATATRGLGTIPIHRNFRRVGLGPTVFSYSGGFLCFAIYFPRRWWPGAGFGNQDELGCSSSESGVACMRFETSPSYEDRCEHVGNTERPNSLYLSFPLSKLANIFSNLGSGLETENFASFLSIGPRSSTGCLFLFGLLTPSRNTVLL